MSCFDPDVSRVRNCDNAVFIEKYGNARVYGYKVYCSARRRKSCPVYTHNDTCLLAEVR